MSAVIVIPARYASSRFPGKPRAPLRGAGGQARPLIQRTWEAARAARRASAVFVATDDARIREVAEGFGAQVVMTSDRAANGTERCAEALAALPGDAGIVVNFQGDAPLTPPWFIDDLIAHMERTAAQVATPVLRTDPDALADLLADRKAGRVGGTTAVFGADRRALYFSKEVIPFAPDPATAEVFHHVGVYAYRREALAAYPGLWQGPLERQEGLEQLRFLEHGIPVDCVEVDARGRTFWELNNPVDVARIEAVLQREGMA